MGAGTFMVVDSLEGLMPTGDATILPVCRRKKIREWCGSLDCWLMDLGYLGRGRSELYVELLNGENGLGAR